MNGGCSGDDVTNYTVRIFFLCKKECKTSQWLIKNEARKKTSLTTHAQPSHIKIQPMLNIS